MNVGPVFPSPDGRFRVVVEPWEARMSLWVECPIIESARNGEVLFRFPNHLWSLDQAEWLNDARVLLGLRKYPGNHLPPTLWVEVDCAAGHATVGNRQVKLAELAALAVASLTWQRAGPPHRLPG